MYPSFFDGNSFVYIERNTLRQIPIPIPKNARPRLSVELGPTVANVLLRDMNANPYNVQDIFRLPIDKMICAYLTTQYDVSRWVDEAEEVRLRFTPKPYDRFGIPVEARILSGTGSLLPLPGSGDFSIYRVMSTPIPLLVGDADLWLFSRKNPTPPEGGLRAVAWARDVSFDLVPELTRSSGGLTPNLTQ